MILKTNLYDKHVLCFTDEETSIVIELEPELEISV